MDKFIDILIQWITEGKIGVGNLYMPVEIYHHCKDRGYTIFAQLTADRHPSESDRLVIDLDETPKERAIKQLEAFHKGPLYRVQIEEFQPPIFCPYHVAEDLYRNHGLLSHPKTETVD